MSMYVVQVKPGTDLQAAVLLRKRGHLVRCPQRTMDIRKNGKWNSITEPVFPGYLFLEEEIDRQKYDSVVQSDGVSTVSFMSGLVALIPAKKPTPKNTIKTIDKNLLKEFYICLILSFTKAFFIFTFLSTFYLQKYFIIIFPIIQ